MALLTIRSNSEIKYEKLLSLRKKMCSSKINIELSTFLQFIQKLKLTKTGPLISATFNYEHINGEEILDTEFLIPVDREITICNQEYRYKPVFHIVNAVSIRHIGSPNTLPSTYEKLGEYIRHNNLQPITAAYNVNINDEQISNGQEPIIDVYIGINPSSL